MNKRDNWTAPEGTTATNGGVLVDQPQPLAQCANGYKCQHHATGAGRQYSCGPDSYFTSKNPVKVFAPIVPAEDDAPPTVRIPKRRRIGDPDWFRG